MSINQQIAKRLGWQVESWNDWHVLVSPEGHAVVRSQSITEREAWTHCPHYLTDRNAAQEIVAWFAARRDEVVKFEDALYWQMINDNCDVDVTNYPVLQGALATPAQIVAAACKVWGIGGGGRKAIASREVSATDSPTLTNDT